MTQLSNRTSENARHAEMVDKLVEKSMSKTRLATERAESMETSMQQIREASRQTSAIVAESSTKSRFKRTCLP